MKFMGIEFVPLHVPLEKRLETLGAGVLVFFCKEWIPTLLCFLLFFTSWWWLNLLLACWYYLDRHIGKKGGRPSNWVKNWTSLHYAKKYFPAHLVCVPEFKLDPHRNYIFCCFPHGAVPHGPLLNIMTHASEFYQLYPNFKTYLGIGSEATFVPIARDFNLGMGLISCSRKSLDFILTKPEKRQIVLLWPGGVAETFLTHPGQYKFVVMKRKGFVRLALNHGTSLVPVITYGEPDLFEKLDGPVARKIQKFVKKITGFDFFMFNGRGIFQYSYGLIPKKMPLTTVLGKPIDVCKVNNPIDQQIDDLHAKFVEALVQLFDEYKYKYLENPEEKHLELL